MNVESLIAAHVRGMQPYVPIVPLDVLSKRLGLPKEQIVKLDANENPYGTSPRALEAVAASRELHIYPDPDQTALRDALSVFVGVPAAHILCGAGGDEVIDLLARAFVEPGQFIVDLPPTFGMYKWEADVLGAQYVSVPRRRDFSIDIEAVEGTVRALEASGLPPKLLFVTNPNNPDGSVTSRADLLRLLDLPVVVVVDEAYIDFSREPSLAPLVPERDNLVVLRTFSKLAGMAGLRVGYGVFPVPVIKHLWKVKQPYTPNVAGSLMAIAAMQDREWLAHSVQALTAERQRMSDALRALGWIEPLPSETNFVLCRVSGGRDAKAVKQAIERQGVLVRYFDKDGLRDCLRISVGLPEHTDALIAALLRGDVGPASPSPGRAV